MSHSHVITFRKSGHTLSLCHRSEHSSYSINSRTMSKRLVFMARDLFSKEAQIPLLRQSSDNRFLPSACHRYAYSGPDSWSVGRFHTLLELPLPAVPCLVNREHSNRVAPRMKELG